MRVKTPFSEDTLTKEMVIEAFVAMCEKDPDGWFSATQVLSQMIRDNNASFQKKTFAGCISIVAATLANLMKSKSSDINVMRSRDKMPPYTPPELEGKYRTQSAYRYTVSAQPKKAVTPRRKRAPKSNNSVSSVSIIEAKLDQLTLKELAELNSLVAGRVLKKLEELRNNIH